MRGLSVEISRSHVMKGTQKCLNLSQMIYAGELFANDCLMQNDMCTNCFKDGLNIFDCLLRMLQIQLHEIANFVFNATGSSFCLETLCRVVYRLGIKAYGCNIDEFLLRCAFNLILDTRIL